VDQSIYTQLAEFYFQRHIHPEAFDCPHQGFCRTYAYSGKMTETKMSLVGSQYGELYPRIAVLSLDPPLGEEGKFTEPYQRTCEYITAITEKENYTFNRPNPHWAVTQIIVCDILRLFGFQPGRNAATVRESYSGRPIENVSSYFAHINACKCSMNWPDKGQANTQVHLRCSQSYLLPELEILAPIILISQGKSANRIAGQLFHIPGFEKTLPNAARVEIRSNPLLWLPMDHPARRTAHIRERWPIYINEIKKWME
jgi:hypothetical protein